MYIVRKQEILFHYSFYDIPDDWLELVYYCVLERAWSCVYFIGNLDSISLEQYGFGAQQIYGGHVISCYEGSSKHVPVFMVRIRFPLIVFRTQMNFLVVIDADRMLWLAYRAAHVGVLQRL